MTIVFDLDGTLLDTREAVRLAYRDAGVVMPDYAWGRPYQEWLPQRVGIAAETIHTLKNIYYAAHVARAQPLELLEFAERFHSPILTGASRGAVDSIRLHWPQLNIVGWGMSLEDKVNWLNRRKEPLSTMTYYVDDDAHARATINFKTPWIALDPKDALRLCQFHQLSH